MKSTRTFGRRAFSWAASSRPLIPGMITSVNNRSMCRPPSSASTSARAAGPSGASRTVYPFRSRSWRVTARTGASSSTTRIVSLPRSVSGAGELRVLRAVLDHQNAQSLGGGHRLLRRVIQQEPVEPDVGDGTGKGLEVHGFNDIAVGAQGVGALDVRFLAG